MVLHTYLRPSNPDTGLASNCDLVFYLRRFFFTFLSPDSKRAPLFALYSFSVACSFLLAQIRQSSAHSGFCGGARALVHLTLLLICVRPLAHITDIDQWYE